ncbi:hypothetical protein V8E36_001945 [Tilletia maclaganii]
MTRHARHAQSAHLDVSFREGAAGPRRICLFTCSARQAIPLFPFPLARRGAASHWITPPMLLLPLPQQQSPQSPRSTAPVFGVHTFSTRTSSLSPASSTRSTMTSTPHRFPAQCCIDFVTRPHLCPRRLHLRRGLGDQLAPSAQCSRHPPSHLVDQVHLPETPPHSIAPSRSECSASRELIFLLLSLSSGMLLELEDQTG